MQESFINKSYCKSSAQLKLLAEAHDKHLSAAHIEDGAKLLCSQPGEHQKVRDESEQIAFRELLEEELLVRIRCVPGRQGLEIYSPSLRGQALLREHALCRDCSVKVSHCHWETAPTALTWALPQEIWESYQGKIHGTYDRDGTESTLTSTPIADVELYKLNQAIARRSGFDLQESLESSPELAMYRCLVEQGAGEGDGHPDDLLEFAGFDRLAGGSVLIVHRLQIRSAFLGLGLGRQMLARLAARYMPEGGVMVLRATPLQFGSSNETLEGQYEEAKKNLEAYYFRLGFMRHPGNPELLVCEPARSRGLSSLETTD